MKEWIKSLYPLYKRKAGRIDEINYKFAKGINGNPDFVIDVRFVKKEKSIEIYLCSCIENATDGRWLMRLNKIE